ncbi:MAG: bifunctional (p)ppGpp synthetase/guanosine-3',5'-bis(diphosphate) 3'-pyrophosphohydrolase [Betaproteobacteria bacterium]|nr:bifunctional (p)ppGpp synthetase/guanosine-3',5'-bis(diphosphate) 3'-pyrophosphohydrolase [Betaproteobacteria bacterium]
MITTLDTAGAADAALAFPASAGTFAPAERALIDRAAALALPAAAGVRTAEGEDMARHVLGVAQILAALKLDHESVAAALLLGYPERVEGGGEKLREAFGGDIATLVEGVARMGQIHNDAGVLTASERVAQAERLRKMLLAMVDDIRIVLIKLAERVQTLRFLVPTDGDVRKAAAKEVLELFAPLANRLGVWQIKWELEDLSLRALEPEVYKSIARALDERRHDREAYIRKVMAMLAKELAAAGIHPDVAGRPKHIYSIYKKMQRKGSGIDALYDIRAVRVLVPDVKDCYAALGVVHNLWTPLPSEFDDYIARPKPNDYRSLHTAVIGPDGKPLEVQIRTVEMHQHSEYGVAAHWRYKEAGRSERSNQKAGGKFDDKIAWLRQILDWKKDVAGPGEWLEQFKTSLFEDTIYVFTPQGKVIDLPAGSTPVDFAYQIHSNLGHRCRGAKVNGVMVPLNTPLQNGQRVEVITVKEGGPSRDWLNPELGYLVSSRGRTKVRQWFKSLQIEGDIAAGRATIEAELKREGFGDKRLLNLEDVAREAGIPKLDDFFAAVAHGDLNSRQIQLAIRATAKLAEAPPADEDVVVARQSKAAGSGSGILIVGVDKLLTGLGKCCKPAPPDSIIGFVTRGKGITIHRQSCPNVVRMRVASPERLITADWGTPKDEVFPVDIEVEAIDRQGLLRDISEVFSREKINVTAVNTLSKNMQARMFFTVEVQSLAQLKQALRLVEDVKGVLSAGRR